MEEETFGAQNSIKLELSLGILIKGLLCLAQQVRCLIFAFQTKPQKYCLPGNSLMFVLDTSKLNILSTYGPDTPLNATTITPVKDLVHPCHPLIQVILGGGCQFLMLWQADSSVQCCSIQGKRGAVIESLVKSHVVYRTKALKSQIKRMPLPIRRYLKETEVNLRSRNYYGAGILARIS